MYLQRYASTVYSEWIPEKYFKDLTPGLNTISQGADYSTIRNLYTIKHEKYDSGTPESNYILDTLFFNVLFGNTLGRIYKQKKNSIVLFPVFQDIDSTSRLLETIKKIYVPILEIKKKEKQEFVRDEEGNMYLFVPVFSENDETGDEYKSRLTSYLDRSFEFINDQKPKRIGDVEEKKRLQKFENIFYTIDKNNQFFTNYYKTKLSSDKSKIANDSIEKFVEKLGGRITKVNDPILKLTKEDSRKKFVSDGQKRLDLLEKFYDVIDTFTDIYKKVNDKEYFKLASSSENQTVFRIFYRVNNTDYTDVFDAIRPGSSYVYKLTLGQECYIGYFKERRGATNQYIFREYTGLSAQNCKNDSNPGISSLEEQEELDLKKDAESKTEDYIIETRRIGGQIKYKRVKDGEYGQRYPGLVERFADLHIYEKYKFFSFNELDSSLPSETNIKIYKNILFDKKSFIDFLKSKNQYNAQTRVAVEFLKINQKNNLLLEYVDFLSTTREKTHVFKESFFGGELKPFLENTKRKIVEMLFETNEKIYLNQQRIVKKTEGDDYYRIISYNYYLANKNHFEQQLYEDQEMKYCKKSTCELLPLLENAKKNVEYAVAIVDITKEKISSVSELKAKTKCKKLKRTLRRQLEPFFSAVLPRFGKVFGGKSMKRLTRRRKNRH
jgi:hypothetical protein